MLLYLAQRHDLAGWLWTSLVFVIHLLVTARAITRPNRAPVSRIAWVAVILLFPILGVIAYLVVGETRIDKARLQRLRAAKAELPLPVGGTEPACIDERAGSLFAFGQSISGLPAVSGNSIELMADSNAAIASLVADIEQAHEHIHISFYIWLDDHNGGKVADALSAAARRGVHCRVMVDALGSRAFLASPRRRQLQDAGVHLVATLKDVPRIGALAIGRVDLRDHRKIVVIDGSTSYCGSQNCADPEFRIKAEFAPWVDIFLRCQGPMVLQEQYLFLLAWAAEAQEPVAGLPLATPAVDAHGDGCVAQMFSTGPTTHGNPMSGMFVACMYAARHELVITTPYFAPDEAILRALCAAPRRGVATTIVFPARNDSWLVGKASRSMYADLIDAGVGVHEYQRGLLHAKSLTIDGEIALVGSANMDRRSLELNYENNLLVADRDFTATIRARQGSYLADSSPVSADTVHNRPYFGRLVENIAAMLSPLL